MHDVTTLIESLAGLAFLGFLAWLRYRSEKH
jgi:hypothetical protein